MTDAELRTWALDWAPHPASEAVCALLGRVDAVRAMLVQAMEALVDGHDADPLIADAIRALDGEP